MVSTGSCVVVGQRSHGTLSPEGLTLHEHVYFIDAGLDIHGNETQPVDMQVGEAI